MLISFFKKSFIPQYIALIAIQGILWLPAFLSPESFQHSFSHIKTPGHQLLTWLFDEHQFSAILTASILILFFGFILNYTLAHSGLSPKNSLLTVLIFYILAAHQPWLLQLHPSTIPAFVLILILYLLFDLYHEREAYSAVFYSGFLLAIATLFYLPMIIFSLMIFFTFIVYRIISWREWVIFILGFLTVALILLTGYFWFDQLDNLLALFSASIYRIHWIEVPKILPIGFALEALIIVLFFIAFFISGNRLNEKIISIRKRFWVIIWALIIAFFSILISGNNAGFHYFLILVPISIIFSIYLSETKKPFWPNILLLLLILLIIFNNFYMVVEDQYF